MIVSLVAAMDRQGVIGSEGAIPWHLPEDLRRFKRLTVGHPVIMGRKTYESLPPRFRPLPERRNIVLSRVMSHVSGCETASSPEQALKLCRGEDEVFVIGGGEIYRLFLPWAKRMYLTIVETEVPGDTSFPAFDVSQWQEVSRNHGFNADGELNYSFVDYERAAGALQP